MVVRLPRSADLEALAVNNSRSRFIILLLGDPHLLECGEGSKDGATNPDGVLTLWRGNNLDLHRLRSKSLNLLLHTLSNSGEHSGTARKNGIRVEVLTDINITLHDAIVSGLCDTILLKSDEGRLKEDLRATESFVSDGDNLTVRKFVGLLESAGLFSLLHFSVEVKSNVGKLFLDVTNDFTLSGGGERVSTLGKDLDKVVGKVTTSKVKTHNSMWQSITLVDRNSVGNTIS
mmetsp:Transcript_14398/g.20102  ORF Transcript_14398/g.20102 Transcript_14398/m.20102 type:complete len:232 (-) Transcript_14398:759-1454(-)